MDASKSFARAIRREQRKYMKLNASIISNTCLGGVIYNDYHAQFLSPTIDMYIPPMDFIKFCMDMKGYLNEKIKKIDIKCSKGFIPVCLGDVRIFFTHSNSSFEKGVKKWDERKERINWNKIKIICTDRETVYTPLGNCGRTCIESFEKISYKDKVFFTVNDVHTLSSVYLVSFCDEICVPEATRKSPVYNDKYIVETDGFDLDSFVIK